MATVPGNNLQAQLLGLVKNQKKASYGVQNRAKGVLLKIFDADTAPTNDLPVEILQSIIKAPGRLYGSVQLTTGGVVHLPLKDGPEVIYGLYGDSVQIIGRSVEILYYDHNIKRGEIRLLPLERTAVKNTTRSINVFDIGGIL